MFDYAAQIEAEHRIGVDDVGRIQRGDHREMPRVMLEAHPQNVAEPGLIERDWIKVALAGLFHQPRIRVTTVPLEGWVVAEFFDSRQTEGQSDASNKSDTVGANSLE